MIVIYFLLILNVGRCTNDFIFETKTVGVGDDVNLTCSRQTTGEMKSLFWFRHVSGNLPEVLGGTFNFDFDVVNNTPHFTTKQEPGTFLLNIKETRLSDTGFYYCIQVQELKMTILNGTILRIKGPEPDVTAIIESLPSAPVRPGASVTLQCSVLSDSEKKTCPGDHSVYWFRAGSDTSHPSFIYTPGNNSEECGKTPEAHSPQRCVYNFTKSKVSSSDAGTYHCAVATCGEILFGNGTKLYIEETSLWSQKTKGIVLLLSAVLVISLIAFIIYAIKENYSLSSLQNAGQKSQQRDDNTLVYSAVVFTVMKTDCGAMKSDKGAESQKIYTASKAFNLD